MISKEEFNVLYYLIKNPTTTNQQIAEAIGVSLREARDIYVVAEKSNVYRRRWTNYCKGL